MANFLEAFKISMDNAGGYVNDPDDPGQETYRDISRKYNPTWSGWSRVDQIKRQMGGTIPKNFTDKGLDQSAASFYKTNYWDKLRLDLVNSQQNANQLFDQLLDGISRTVQMVKIVLNKILPSNYAINSVVDSQLINDINRAKEDRLFNEFKELRRKRFMYAGSLLSSTDPTYSFFAKFGPPPSTGPKFVKGWLNRVNKYSIPSIVGGASAFILVAIAAFFFLKK